MEVTSLYPVLSHAWHQIWQWSWWFLSSIFQNASYECLRNLIWSGKHTNYHFDCHVTFDCCYITFDCYGTFDFYITFDFYFLSVQQVVDEHNQVHYIQLTCDGSDAGNLVHVINANLVDSVGVSSKGLDDASYAFDQNEVLNGGPLHLVHHWLMLSVVVMAL